jgi:hypothetical protein
LNLLPKTLQKKNLKDKVTFTILYQGLDLQLSQAAYHKGIAAGGVF